MLDQLKAALTDPTQTLGFLTSLLGMALYWAPWLFCLVGYALRTWDEYQKDVKARSSGMGYLPTLTVGRVLWRVIVSFIPGINLTVAAVDLLPKLAMATLTWLERTFSKPLVPDSSKWVEVRKRAREESNT